MTCGRRRPVFWATGATLVCLLGVATAVSVPAVASAEAGQAAPAQAPLVTENWFKNIQVLKGIPVDTFLDAMGMFAASMGDDCTYCHSKAAVADRDAFAVTTPRILRARQMIVMMRTINNNYFGGAPRVTCFTCHRGAYMPVNAPRLALQYGSPEEDPNVMDFVLETKVSADQVLDRYIQALGGAGPLAKVASFVAKGTYSGFDTGFGEVPVEIMAKTPNQRAWIVHMISGDSHRIFDGRNGWIAGRDSPAPLVTLSSGNLDLARLQAIVAFPAAIKQAFSQWRVGNTIIDGRDVRIVQGTNPGLLPVNLYFDTTSGLLVRLVRWNETPVGPVPSQIDYDDYRDVAGVKMPFTWTITQTYMQMTIKLSGVQPNVPIDASRFAQPAPATR